MVHVTADTSSVAEKDEEYFCGFDVICATGCPPQQLQRLNNICHRHSILFFAGDVFGFYGSLFSDLNAHEYAE